MICVEIVHADSARVAIVHLPNQSYILTCKVYTRIRDQLGATFGGIVEAHRDASPDETAAALEMSRQAAAARWN